MHAKETHPNSIETRLVRLYAVSKREIWMHIDDVNWAVKYLYAQHMLKGVAAVSPDDVGPSGAAAVPEESTPPDTSDASSSSG